MVREMGRKGRELESVRLARETPTGSRTSHALTGMESWEGAFAPPTRVFFLHSIQGSLDNMTCVVVCFPGAPRPCEEAVSKEMALNEVLSRKVAGEQVNGQWEGRGALAGSRLTSSSPSELYASAHEPPCLNTVFRNLASEDIPGLPPGGGLHSK